MSPRDAGLQAAALRLAAERLERGEPLAPSLANAVAEDMSRHPEEAQSVDVHEGPLPKWMADELDRRERDDVGTEEDGEAVMARLPATRQMFSRTFSMAPWGHTVQVSKGFGMRLI